MDVSTSGGGKSNTVIVSGGRPTGNSSTCYLAPFVLSSFCVFRIDAAKNPSSRVLFWGDGASVTNLSWDSWGSQTMQDQAPNEETESLCKVVGCGHCLGEFPIVPDPQTYSQRRHQKKPKYGSKENHYHPTHPQSLTRLWSGTYH